MSDIKVVLYRDNRTPRSISLSSRIIYSSLLGVIVLGAVAVILSGVTARLFWLDKVRSAQSGGATSPAASEEPAPGSLEEQNKILRDQVEQGKSQLANAQKVISAPRDIDKGNPALALFSPIVVDKTKDNDVVKAMGFKFTKQNGSNPPTLSCELHNAHPNDTTAKGYIVVLARKDTALHAYPNIFNSSGPYLLDFEKGETFQVARFRMVNAQFDIDAKQFQILIFTRNGELLVNTNFEVPQ